jgi:hypothetical protein
MAAVGLATLTTAAQMAAQAAETKWRAKLVLVTEDERTCGTQHSRQFDVAIEGDVIRRWVTSGSGSTYDYRLLAPLKADGSGKVMALNDKKQKIMLDIDPGNGPRTIRISPVYGVCTWAWVPVRS